MLNIEKFDHIGIRISDREKSVEFYQRLGFDLIADGGYENGHPLVMVHPSGININLLGPATADAGENILMDRSTKSPGITHIALMMKDADEAEKVITENNIKITGRRNFRGVKTIFIRDPDGTVLELVGNGPAVSDLIKEHIQETMN